MADREAIATLAHKVYLNALAERRVYLSRPFSKDKGSWLKLADFVIAAKLDVVKFVTAQIEAVTKREDLLVFKPSRICEKTGEAMARYQKVVPVAGIDVHRRSYITMLGHLASLKRRLIPRVMAGVDEILINPGFPFSAWFRVLLAPAGSEGYPHIMKCYLEQAVEDTIADPCLRQFLEEMKNEYDLTRFGWSA